MKITAKKRFKKALKTRITPNKKLLEKFYQTIELFKKDPYDEALRNHQLHGTQREFRSISVTGDIRITFLQVPKSEIILVDIGTHNQLYKK